MVGAMEWKPYDTGKLKDRRKLATHGTVWWAHTTRSTQGCLVCGFQCPETALLLSVRTTDQVLFSAARGMNWCPATNQFLSAILRLLSAAPCISGCLRCLSPSCGRWYAVPSFTLAVWPFTNPWRSSGQRNCWRSSGHFGPRTDGWRWVLITGISKFWESLCNRCLRVEWLLHTGSQNPPVSVDRVIWKPVDFGGFVFPIL